MKAFVFLVLGLFVFELGAQSTGPNVILVTADGVRFQEIFNGVRKLKATLPIGTELLPLFKAQVKNNEAFLFRRMFIANTIGLSLPGYRSILTGDFETKCTENDCANIDRETIFDYLIGLGMQKNQLATFASWDQIAMAIESKPGQIVRSIKMEEYVDSTFTPAEQAQVDAIHLAMTTNLPPWIGSRYDKYTHELAKIYLKKHQPRLLYLSYIEPDEYAHKNDYDGYVQAIKDLDAHLADLQNHLKTLGDYGANTSIVVSTDHGRGRGFLWKNHSREYLSAIQVWAMVIPSPNMLAQKKFRVRKNLVYSHKDIRPTVEALLGVPLRTGKKKGKSLIKIN